jgi:hypothetical protein
MYKKSLSGLSCVLLLSFSLMSACESTPPASSQQNTQKNIDFTKSIINSGQKVFDTIKSPNTAVNNQTGTNNNTNTANPQQNGNLSDQASNANPIPVTTPSNTPNPNSSGSPGPSPSPTPASSFDGPSGQLNLIINPNPPCQAPC